MIRKQTLDLTDALKGYSVSAKIIYGRRCREFLTNVAHQPIMDMRHIEVQLLQQALTKADAMRWLVALRNSQPNLGQSALDLARSAIVFLARTAAEEGIIDDEIYLSIQSIKPLIGETGQRPGTWLMVDEIVCLVAVLNEKEIWQPMFQARNKALILLMLFCGIRVGEAAAARWSDLMKQGQHLMLRIHGKGEKVGYVKLPDEVIDALEEWRKHHPSPTTVAFIFVNAHHRSRFHQPLHADAIWKYVQAAGHAAGLATLAPHDLRRTFARMVYEAGASFELIRQTLRHEQVTMTAHYVNAQMELDHTATDFLADYLEV